MTESTHVLYADATPCERAELGIRALGATVERVASIEGCLEAFETASAVVCAATLADGDAVACCQRLRSAGFYRPIIVYTGNGSEHLASEVIAAGGDGYIPHSAGIETLLGRLRSALESSAERVENRHLQSLVEQSPLAIVECDRAGEIVAWNPAATELFGYAATEASGQQAIELLVAEGERESIIDRWEEIQRGGETVRTVVPMVRTDGSTVTCEWVLTPLTDDDGTLLSVLGFIQDVAADVKRIDALEALQETTQKLLTAQSERKIASLVVSATTAVLERPQSIVRLYEPQADQLAVVAASDNFEDRTLEPVGPGDGPRWQAYERGEPQLLENLHEPADSPTLAGDALAHPLGTHGLLTVRSSGAIELGDTERTLVSAIATTAEAALDRISHVEELEWTQTVIETVGDGIYVVDRRGRFVSVNETLSEVVGYAESTLLGSHLSTILTDESAERAMAQGQEMLADERDAVRTCRITVETAAGEHVPCEVNMALLRPDGSFSGTVGIVRDISDRNRMERELVDRKEKIERLHDVAHTLEECESRQEICQQAVAAAEGVLNFDICAVELVHDGELVTEAVSTGIGLEAYRDRQPVAPDLAVETLERGRTSRHEDGASTESVGSTIDEYRSVLSVPIGHWGVFQAVSTAREAFDRHDEELAELLLSHVADALERVAFDDQLREERDRFAALFENVPDAVVSTRTNDDGEPIVEQINPAFERVFGYEADAIVGQSLDRFIVPAGWEVEADRFNTRRSRGELVEGEVKRRTADGLRDFMMRAVPVDAGDSDDRTFGVYTDITEQKQRQKRVEILNRVLRHDLRNGMNIINGCAEMLTDVIEDETNVTYAETIQERAAELISLAEKTRAVERTIDRGDSATGPVDVIDGVENAIEKLESTYPDAEITCSTPERAFARADDLLRTAIFHVVENAVEHNDLPVPTVDIELTEANAEGDGWRLTVADNGPGIPTAERELLAEDKEITQLRHASGLGLWMVNWVVTQSGGLLRFEENEPRGTIVSLYVPRAETVTATPESSSARVSD